ncbi:unnamed protein product [Rhizophagus irregularis]|uniref:Uncharacterized protein n=1 Tax=Rhizophagus irregularis TaxID=588596 RepID=A0A2I1GB54_9GLOM|nr:hypothetical protein RhiirA4_457952 [Rhizophagus irregularis]CAB4426762.1 unnamed protein product [Rhizophagus irregularis]
MKNAKSITFYYDCSQKDSLKQNSKKYFDHQKHCDHQQMNCYPCKRCIKISIYKDFADIKMQHILHFIQIDVSIPPEIKIFILDNIDLLPHEIYKRFVKHGLNLNIQQKQIHFDG